jgi:hypothetical protein
VIIKFTKQQINKRLKIVVIENAKGHLLQRAEPLPRSLIILQLNEINLRTQHAHSQIEKLSIIVKQFQQISSDRLYYYGLKER